MDDLEKLLEKKEQAQRRYNALQHTNVFGVKAHERIDFDITIEKARQEWFKAMNEYNSAIEKHVKDTA